MITYVSVLYIDTMHHKYTLQMLIHLSEYRSTLFRSLINAFIKIIKLMKNDKIFFPKIPFPRKFIRIHEKQRKKFFLIHFYKLNY